MTLKEILEEFDTRFCKLRSDGYMELVNHHAPDIKAFITTHVTEILEGLRLEKADHTKVENPGHAKDELWCCLECYDDKNRNRIKAELDQKINNILI